MRTLALLLIISVGCFAMQMKSDGSPEQQTQQLYYKPSGMAGVSPYTANVDLSKGPSWTWMSGGHTMGYGSTMDNELNVYFTAIDGIRKFGPNGELLWQHITLPDNVYNTASLANGAVYAEDSSGHAFALDMATGNTIWRTQVTSSTNGAHPPMQLDMFLTTPNGFTNVNDGIMVIDSHRDMASHHAFGLNATDGSMLWSFKASNPFWSFGASFPGDGSVVFQDYTGVAYCLGARDGKLIWKSDDNGDSFALGTANIGPDGSVYTVENNAMSFSENTEGRLTKRRLSDGEVMWQVTTPHPPNNQPLVGHGLVIQGMGSPQQRNATTYVYAYDEETGDVKWVFNGPAQQTKQQAGDEEMGFIRFMNGLPYQFCLPTPWSSPSFGDDGTVYIGNQAGGFYSLRDTDGDGVVSWPEEVSVYNTAFGFAGSSSPAIAPGMVAIASCDGLAVFKK